MNDVDDNERWAMGFHSLGETTCNTSECPDPDRLWEAASAGQTSADRRVIIEHIATCPACAEDWRVAASLSDAAKAAELQGTSARVEMLPRARKRWAWGASVAVAVSGMAAAFLLFLQPGPRATESPARLRGGSTPLSSPVEGYGFRATHFDWPDAGSGTEYDLWIVAADFSPITSIEGLKESHFQAPPDLTARLRQYETFYWQVKSRRPNGETSISPTIIAQPQDR